MTAHDTKQPNETVTQIGSCGMRIRLLQLQLLHMVQFLSVWFFQVEQHIPFAKMYPASYEADMFELTRMLDLRPYASHGATRTYSDYDDDDDDDYVCLTCPTEIRKSNAIA